MREYREDVQKETKQEDSLTMKWLGSKRYWKNPSHQTASLDLDILYRMLHEYRNSCIAVAHYYVLSHCASSAKLMR